MSEVKLFESAPSAQHKEKVMYEFTSAGLLKNGQPFFNNPLGMFGRLYLGRIMPSIPLQPSWARRTEVILGGGECCHGFVVAVSQYGQIEKILELDLNVAAIVPLIRKDGWMSFLVSGSGCDGSGIRLIEFAGRPSKMSVVVGGDEANYLIPQRRYAGGPDWFNVHPLDIPTIWELLSRHDIDREKTEEAQEAFGVIGERHAVRGHYTTLLQREERLKKALDT